MFEGLAESQAVVVDRIGKIAQDQVIKGLNVIKWVAFYFVLIGIHKQNHN